MPNLKAVSLFVLSGFQAGKAPTVSDQSKRRRGSQFCYFREHPTIRPWMLYLLAISRQLSAFFDR